MTVATHLIREEDAIIADLVRIIESRDFPERLVLAPSGPEGSLTQDPRYHFHDSWELKICVEGEMTCVLVSGPLRLRANRVLMIPPGCLHLSQEHCPEAPAARWLDMILSSEKTILLRRHEPHGSIVERVFQAKAYDSFTELLMVEPVKVLERLMLAIPNQSDSKRRHYGDSLLNLFLTALAETLAQWPFSLDNIADTVATSINNILYQNLHYPDLTLEAVARKLGYSPNYLNSLYRGLTGRTIRQELIRKRLRLAWNLLGNGKYSIKEIAYLTGWRNQRYFATAFRKQYRLSPSEVRAGNLKKSGVGAEA